MSRQVIMEHQEEQRGPMFLVCDSSGAVQEIFMTREEAETWAERFAYLFTESRKNTEYRIKVRWYYL